jgi:hypothetical protein
MADEIKNCRKKVLTGVQMLENRFVEIVNARKDI